MSSQELPLPYGWTQEFDPKTDHPFWVDTKADPPRAIWTHPYDDELYLQEHPEVREKVESIANRQDSKDSPTSKPRRHSFNGQDNATMVEEEDEATPDSSKKGKGKAKRGFFGKLKDKAIGTKEEREAHRIEQARIELEKKRRYTEMINAQRARYAQEQALYEQEYARGAPSQQRYGPPQGDPYVYGRGPQYGGGYGYGYGYDDYDDYGGRRRRNRGGFGGGGGGSAVPMLGALAGGLLLGDIIGGGLF